MNDHNERECYADAHSPHPGEIIRKDGLKPLDLTITEAADGLGISRKNLSRILNGHIGVSPDMAVRLANAFGSTPEMWLKLQMDYDLAQVRKKDENNHVKQFAPA